MNCPGSVGATRYICVQSRLLVPVAHELENGGNGETDPFFLCVPNYKFPRTFSAQSSDTASHVKVSWVRWKHKVAIRCVYKRIHFDLLVSSVGLRSPEANIRHTSVSFRCLVHLPRRPTQRHIRDLHSAFRPRRARQIHSWEFKHRLHCQPKIWRL